MKIRPITPDFAVSPQVLPGDLVDVAAAGYRSIICNRPDGEAAGQPEFQEIERAATMLGLEARHIPIKGGLVADADTRAFDGALCQLPGPILAYCRSGTRSTTLWSLAEASRRPLDEILELTRAAGHDMSKVVRRIAAASP